MLGGRDTSFRAPLIDLRKSCQQRQLEGRLMTLVNDCRVMGLRKRRLNIHKEGQKQGRGSPQHLPAPQRGLLSPPPTGNSVPCCPATNVHFLPQMHTLRHINKLAGVDQYSRGVKEILPEKICQEWAWQTEEGWGMAGMQKQSPAAVPAASRGAPWHVLASKQLLK